MKLFEEWKWNNWKFVETILILLNFLSFFHWTAHILLHCSRWNCWLPSGVCVFWAHTHFMSTRREFSSSPSNRIEIKDVSVCSGNEEKRRDFWATLKILDEHNIQNIDDIVMFVSCYQVLVFQTFSQQRWNLLFEQQQRNKKKLKNMKIYPTEWKVLPTIKCLMMENFEFSFLPDLFNIVNLSLLISLIVTKNSDFNKLQTASETFL